MDVPLVIRQRLEELGLEQRDLAVAPEVTEYLHFPVADSEEIAPRA